MVIVSNKDELLHALNDSEVKRIIVNGTIGDVSNYNVYGVMRENVSIKGSNGSKVYGTFMVKADNVSISDLAIQNKGDAQGQSTNNRAAIYIYANNVTLKNNNITNGLEQTTGLSNGIQIMSPTENNPLSNYAISGNTLMGHENEVGEWSSSGIVIAQGYNPSSTDGKPANAITAESKDYDNLIESNTFTHNKIDLTHQDWSKEAGNVILFLKNSQ